MPSRKKVSSKAKKPQLKIKLLKDAVLTTNAIKHFTGRKNPAEVVCDALNLYFLALFAQTRNLPLRIGGRWSSKVHRVVDIRDPDMGGVFRILSGKSPCVLVNLLEDQKAAEEYFKRW